MESNMWDFIIKSVAGVIIAKYFPDATRNIWKYIVSPISRFTMYVPVRVYRNWKGYEPVPKMRKFKEVRNEFLYNWYIWVRFGGKFPLTYKEQTKQLEYERWVWERNKRFDAWVKQQKELEEQGISK